MRKKSKELLDKALRELHSAINEGKEEVELVLEKDFSGGKKKLQKFSDKYELKKVTEMLKKEFSNYTVKSVIYEKPKSMAILSFKFWPCINISSYSLIWKLTLQPK